MSDEADAPVGYKSPPKHTRFRKGGPQPQRRKKADETIDVHALMSAPVKVGEGKTARKMHPYELALRKAVINAIKGNIPAISFLINEFARHRIIAPTVIESEWPMSLHPPFDYDRDLWEKNLKKLGPPPWPGEDDGISRLQELRDAMGR